MARYWVGGGSTTNWSATANTNWATTSGGANNASVPISTDDVFFDGSSGVGNSVISANISIQSLDCTGFTGTITHNGPIILTIAGNGVVCKFSSGMAMSNNAGATIAFTGTSGTNLLTTAGKTINVLRQNGAGGTTQLQDALTCGNVWQLWSGTWDTNGFAVSCVDRMDDTQGGTSVRAWAFGSSTITTVNGNASSATNLTVNAGTSTILINGNNTNAKTWQSAGKTYYNLQWTALSSGTLSVDNAGTYNQVYMTGAGTGAMTITGSNTIGTFKVDTPPHTVKFTAGTTQTITTWNASGTAGNLITINSATTATHALTKAGGGVVSADYLSIQHSVASPGSTWYAGVNSTNNQAVATAGSGWIFSAPSTATPKQLSALGAG